MKHIASPLVARMLGIKTGTLAKWRRTKRGPQDWLRLSATLVVYPEEAVERYLSDKRAAKDKP